MTSDKPLNSITETGRENFLRLWLIALAVKLAASVFIPLISDEAYYWVWTRKLDWSYFDHPPMVAWWLALGRPLEFLGQGVRWPAVIVAHFVPWIWWDILKPILPARNRQTWLWLFLLCPMTGLGSILVTPDLPLMVFWSLALREFLRACDGRRESPALFGLWLGLGFCSKYHIILLPLCLLPLLADREMRKAWTPWAFLQTAIVGLLACFPVLFWNQQHDWVSFKFQLNHGLAHEGFDWHSPGDYFLGEGLLIFPTVLWAAVRFRARTGRERALLFTGFGPLLFFFATSFRSATELNWPIMAYPSLFALAAIAASSKALRTAMGFWLVVQAAVIVSACLPAAYEAHGKLAELTRFRDVRALPATQPPLFTTTYQAASSLWYWSKIPVYKVAGVSRFDMFDLWPESRPTGPVFRLLMEDYQDVPANLLSEGYRPTELPSPGRGMRLVEMRKP